MVSVLAGNATNVNLYLKANLNFAPSNDYRDKSHASNHECVVVAAMKHKPTKMFVNLRVSRQVVVVEL